MNALILAAGFGTRMGRLSLKTAKPLLDVAGKPVVQHLFEKIVSTGKIDSITVISNQYYYDQFRTWLDASGFEAELLNDGATDNENRRGAIADLKYSLETIGGKSPLMVMAGDNLYQFDFSDMIDYHIEKNADVVAARQETDPQKLMKTGVASLDASGRIVDFQEKPAEPESQYAVPCLYIFTPRTLSLVDEYLSSGENPDAPGHFVSWLHSRVPVYAFRFDSNLYSIGDIESYEQTRKVLER